MAAKPSAAPSRAALKADRARVDMVNSSLATEKRPRAEEGCTTRQLRHARRFAGAECDAQCIGCPSGIMQLHPEGVSDLRFIQPCSSVTAKSVRLGARGEVRRLSRPSPQAGLARGRVVP